MRMSSRGSGRSWGSPQNSAVALAVERLRRLRFRRFRPAASPLAGAVLAGWSVGAHAASPVSSSSVRSRSRVDAERRLQLPAVEVADRRRLGQDQVGDAPLAGHDLLDPLVDGAGADQAVADDRAPLADAPGPVPGLVLHRRVPPAVVEHHVVGRGQVEPGTAGLERQHQAPAPGPVLEVADQPVAGAAGQAAVVAGDRHAGRARSGRSASFSPQLAKWVKISTRSPARTRRRRSRRGGPACRSGRRAARRCALGRPRGGCRSA